MRSMLMKYAAILAVLAAFQGMAFAQTKIRASDLVINGESFFAASNIKSELERLARADGNIGASETFRQVAVSGAPIASILNQYKSCNPKPVYLISDGGGIDLMNGNCTDATCTVIKNCKATLEQYLIEMKNSGTKKLLWMIYPDPQKSYAGTLKKNQDIWATVVPEVMATITTPKVLLVDLRPVWAGHYDQYTNDGIHCTNAGGTATATAFWKAMKENNFFDLVGTDASPLRADASVKSAFMDHRVANGRLTLTMAQPPARIGVRITTVSGQTVLRTEAAGARTVAVPLSSLCSGLFCLEVRAGDASHRCRLLVP